MEPYPVLCIPTSKVHVLLHYNHSSLFGGHSGITKCFQTISQCFYCPNLVENLCAYITRCHIYQLHKKGPHIIDAFERGYLAYYGPPTHIICDMILTFTSSLMEAFSRQLNIRIITISCTNHKSLLAEHGIKSLSFLLVKHLEQVWSWSSWLLYSMFCYNSYSSPNLDGFSPYELTFGHKMTINPDLEVQPDIVVSGLSIPTMRNSRKIYSIFAPDCKDLEVKELTLLIETRNAMLI